MNNGPTFGDWTLQRLSENWHGFPDWATFAIRSKENYCLATIGDVDRATAPANEKLAVLMQSAPEMFRALQEVMRVYHRSDCEHPSFADSCADVVEDLGNVARLCVAPILAKASRAGAI